MKKFDSPKLMTKQGYHSTLPSGINLSKTDQAVTPKLNGLRSYERKISKTEIEYVSEFTQMATFREVDSTQTIFLRTNLFYVTCPVKTVGEIIGREALKSLKVLELFGKIFRRYFRFNENHVFIGRVKTTIPPETNGG